MPINEKGEFIRSGKPPASRNRRRARSPSRATLEDVVYGALLIAGLALLVGLFWLLVTFWQWILLGLALWVVSTFRRLFG